MFAFPVHRSQSRSQTIINSLTKRTSSLPRPKQRKDLSKTMDSIHSFGWNYRDRTSEQKLRHEERTHAFDYICRNLCHLSFCSPHQRALRQRLRETFRNIYILNVVNTCDEFMPSGTTESWIIVKETVNSSLRYSLWSHTATRISWKDVGSALDKCLCCY